MSNSTLLRQELSTLLQTAKPTSLNKLKDFLCQNRACALDVVKAFSALHTQAQNGKVLNLLDMVILPNQQKFPEYIAAFGQARINRILPRGFESSERSDLSLINDIVYMVPGMEFLVRYTMSNKASKVKPCDEHDASYQPIHSRESFFNLLSHKLAAAEQPAKRPTTRFSLKF